MTALHAILSAPARLLKALWRFIQRAAGLLTWPARWLVGRWTAARRFFTEVPDDAPLTETLSESFGNRDSLMDTLGGFGEHLDALRQHLLRSVIVLVLTTALCFAFADRLMALLAVPLGDDAQTVLPQLLQLPPLEAAGRLLALGQAGLAKMQVIEPTESVGVFMRVSLLGGTAFAMPWIVFEVYLFIAPGLYPRSRILLLLALPAVSLLFLLGLAFTYFVMLPTAIPFLEDFMGFRAAWRPSAYFGLVTNLMFWVGVAFQMPLIIYALASVGLLRTQQLVAQWRVAVLVIALVAAAITPTTDPVNMGLVMLPMVLLYVVSIVGAWFAERGFRGRSQA
jgi:sec-independent protein translocase protein TatC